MENIIPLVTINWILLIIIDGFLCLLLVSSTREKEWRAAVLSFLALGANSALWILLNLFTHLKWVQGINLGVIIIFVGMVIFSLVKFFPAPVKRDLSAAEQFDERDYMFSRNNLQFHPHLAKKYYSAHPEKREIDEKIQCKPELAEPGHLFYDDYFTPAFDAAFTYLNRTQGAARGEVPAQKKRIEKEKLIGIIKNLARFYGAVDVGITPLKPYHFYSHAGRHAENWGEKIQSNHQTAIVIVVAMDVEMIKQAPALPIVLESSRQYVEAAKIATIIAEYIRSFGYGARAHTDGNYQVMCVPTAVDAGLGTLGRIGIFMHPVYGPCVRLSVVTTELAPGRGGLYAEALLEDASAICSHSKKSIDHFCKICKKCADNCPTQSIPGGDEPSSRGFRHWSINQETCFSYWKNIGTDCGFCIRVCPYTKPDTLIHKLVRFYISRNVVNQRIALFMDDLFYGRKHPIAKKNPVKMF